ASSKAIPLPTPLLAPVTSAVFDAREDGMMSVYRVKCRLDPVTLSAAKSDAGKRLDHFLHEQLPAYSRARLQDWIKQGRVRVNGAERRVSYVLHEADVIQAEPAELTPLRAEAEEIPLRILYEDADVVAIDKPAG